MKRKREDDDFIEPNERQVELIMFLPCTSNSELVKLMQEADDHLNRQRPHLYGIKMTRREGKIVCPVRIQYIGEGVNGKILSIK